jgi:hypothetical protein
MMATKAYTLVLTASEVNVIWQALCEALTRRPGYKDLEALYREWMELKDSKGEF